MPQPMVKAHAFRQWWAAIKVLFKYVKMHFRPAVRSASRSGMLPRQNHPARHNRERQSVTTYHANQRPLSLDTSSRFVSRTALCRIVLAFKLFTIVLATQATCGICCICCSKSLLPVHHRGWLAGSWRGVATRWFSTPRTILYVITFPSKTQA